MQAKRYHLVDLVKFIFSLFIIMIHLSLFADVSVIANYVFSELLGRLAVPFFFTASGYFFYISLMKDENGKLLREKKNLEVLKKYFIRILILYIIWSAIYMLWAVPMNYDSSFFSASVDFILTSVIKCSYYHLWYVYALVFAYPILYLMLKAGLKVGIAITAVLYVLLIFVSSYSFLPMVSEISNFIWSMRTDLPMKIFLRAIPLMFVGVLVAYCGNKISKSKSFIFFVISFVCLGAESSALFFFLNAGVSYLVFTAPTVFFFFNFIRQVDFHMNDTASLYLRNMSTLVYCLHAVFINMCDKFIPQLESTIIRYLIVVAVSVFISLIIVFLSRKCKMKFLKYLY